MNDRGPLAETEWSSETRLQQGMGPDEQATHEGWGYGGLLRTGGGPPQSLTVIITILGSVGAPPLKGWGWGGVWRPPSGSRSPFSGQIGSLPSLHPPHLWAPPPSPAAEALQATPGPRSAGALVIIAILSVLLAVILTALLALLIYTWYVDRA